MPTNDWSTYDMEKDGHAPWLVKTCEKIIGALRQAGGLPSIVTTGYITVTVPTLAAQADVMNGQPDRSPDGYVANGVIKFLD